MRERERERARAARALAGHVITFDIADSRLRRLKTNLLYFRTEDSRCMGTYSVRYMYDVKTCLGILQHRYSHEVHPPAQASRLRDDLGCSLLVPLFIVSTLHTCFLHALACLSQQSSIQPSLHNLSSRNCTAVREPGFRIGLIKLCTRRGRLKHTFLKCYTSE